MANLNLEELEYVRTDSPLSEQEKSDWDGRRVKVDKVEAMETDTPFDEKGQLMAKGPDGEQLRRKVSVVRVTTIPLKTDGAGNPILVSEDFQLGINKQTGKPYAKMHPKSKTAKLFAKYNVNSFPELKGKDIILSKKVRQSGSTYLGISIG